MGCRMVDVRLPDEARPLVGVAAARGSIGRPRGGGGAQRHVGPGRGPRRGGGARDQVRAQRRDGPRERRLAPRPRVRSRLDRPFINEYDTIAFNTTPFVASFRDVHPCPLLSYLI